MSQVAVKCLENKTSNDGSLYGKFIVEPFERGFGTTVGNSLRRILLSSIPGSAVTAIRIEGLTHEFSAIPGVVEDVIDVMLNLKGLAVKSYSNTPQTIRLSAKGPTNVLAKDLQLPADVQIVNPDWHIASVASDGKLDMEIIVENGTGYVPSEKQNAQNRPIDFIPVDSVFMPVKKVACSISSLRTPEGMEYDSLTIEIWSNGTIEPTVALGHASAKLIEKMAPIAQCAGEAINIQAQSVEPIVRPQTEEISSDRRSTLSIEELELSVRAYNCLKRANINSLGELLSLTYSELMNIKNFGKKSADEVLERLHAMGLHLVDETNAPTTGGNYDLGGDFEPRPQAQSGFGYQNPPSHEGMTSSGEQDPFQPSSQF